MSLLVLVGASVVRGVAACGLGVALGLGAAFWPAWRVAGRLARGETNRWERPVLTATLGLGWLTLSVRLLLLVGVGRGPFLLAWLVATAALLELALRRGLVGAADTRGASAEADGLPAARRGEDARGSLPPETWPLLGAGGLAVAVAAFAAVVLPIWAWDALGYHLPLVAFALRRGSIHDVPVGIPYLSTYPDGVEMLFYAVRSWLPSDALVDLSQIGLGVAGSLAIAHVGVSLGASAGVALAAGAAWLTFPAVFLQLPTNYVDVGVAAFLLLALALLAFAPVTRRHLVVGGVALGLYLGSKPNAVVPAALIGGLALFRAVRAQRGAWIVATAALALLLGANKYVANFVRFGNPVWPLAVHLGPWHPPGFIEVKTLLASGARAPRPPAGPLPFRALWSWLSFPGHLVYDTRKGGLGPLFGLFVLPGVGVALVRRAWPPGLGISLGVAALVTLFHPEPSTPRFVLAWFGLAAALAARAGDRLGGRIRVAVFSAAALAALVGLAFAVRGLTGEGPPLLEVARLAPEARIRALNPNGAAAAWQDFESHLRPDDVVAFDESLSMPYLLWRPDLANRVVPLAWRESTAAVAAVLAAEKVTYLVAGDKLPASELAATQPSRFRPLFRCGADPCTVYQIVEP